jgi:hypothetical protein
VKHDVGCRLHAFLADLQAATNWTVAVADRDTSASRWQIGGSTWDAIVVVDPQRWIGLEFEARDPVLGRRVGYDIDTDLYDITQDAERDFADEIERDIIGFLENLRKGRILRGKDGSRVVLVFPRNGFYVRVVKGRFATTATRHVDESAARAGGEYVPVI